MAKQTNTFPSWGYVVIPAFIALLLLVFIFLNRNATHRPHTQTSVQPIGCQPDRHDRGLPTRILAEDKEPRILAKIQRAAHDDPAPPKPLLNFLPPPEKSELGVWIEDQFPYTAASNARIVRLLRLDQNTIRIQYILSDGSDIHTDTPIIHESPLRIKIAPSDTEPSFYVKDRNKLSFIYMGEWLTYEDGSKEWMPAETWKDSSHVFIR